MTNLVDILPAGCTTHVAGCHETDAECLIARLLRLRDLGGIEVGRVVLVQHLSLRHFGL